MKLFSPILYMDGREEPYDHRNDPYEWHNLAGDEGYLAIKQALKEELMELLGERFGDFFVASVSLKVAEEFDRRIYGFVEKEDLAALRTFARPYKPSLR